MGIEKPNQENNPLPREKLSQEQLIALAKIAGFSVKKLKKIRSESEQETNEAIKEREQWKVDQERRRLMEDTQTFNPKTMGRAGGVRQIKSGGRTPVGTVENLKE